MPLVKNVVEFTQDEIKELIRNKASELFGKDVAGQSSTIDLHLEGDGGDGKLMATVTFNSKKK